MPLRFPNPGSDIVRMVNTYRLVHRASRGVDSFDLDFMTAVLTEHNQASSRGAIGAAAVERSRDDDRSRDPLYNQMKMYSEVFRMLGWLRTGRKRLEFQTTILGDLVAEDLVERDDLVYGLLRECLLAVTFPNPVTENVGVANHRPFRWLLLATATLGGSITRHEIILSVLNVTNDREPQAIERAVATVEAVRGGPRSALDETVQRLAAAETLQVTTLENYTRFPVGVMKSAQIGWAESGRVENLYSRPIEALSLLPLGWATAEAMRATVDIREDDLSGFSLEERAHFANFAYYAMLLRAGFEYADVEDGYESALSAAARLRAALLVKGPEGFLYSPVQQASDEVLSMAAELESA